MLQNRRPGAANPASIILSVAVLVLAVAAGYYLVVVAPQNTTASVTDDASSSVSSAAVVNTQPTETNDDDEPASDTMTAEEKANYEGCLNAANEAHNQRWAQACAEHKEIRKSAYLACVEEKEDDAYCTTQFGGYEDIGDDCTLPTLRASALNAQFMVAKEQCK